MGIATTRLPDGTSIPVIGLGTWRMGDAGERGDRAAHRREIASLRLGIELGMTLVDTAEMYGHGASERLVGEAIGPVRDQVFVVTKVLPSHATRRGIETACAQSLRRLGTDRIDLYLLHWPSGEELGEVVDTFEALRRRGDILRWGVSNFDTEELDAVTRLSGGAECASNQVLYNPENRGIEWDLLPACAARGMNVMAYSPVGQGGALLRHPALRAIAERHGTSPAAVSIAWTIRHDGVVAIPKASDPLHVRENAGAADLDLTDIDLREIDAAFPPPKRKRPLAML